MSAIKPRDYQVEAVESVCEYLTKQDGDPVICAPTGAGKSVILSMLTERFVKAGRRVLMATHVGELVKQNADAMGRFGVDVGLYAAGLSKRETKQAAIACQIQSAYHRADEFGTRHALIIDEAHTVNPDESAVRYRQFIEDLRGFNPGLRVIGLTATPYRTGTGSICGKDGFFDDIVYDIPIKMLISRGYLSEVTTEAGQFKLDTGSLRTRMGEYVTQDLENLFGSEDNVRDACEDMLRSTADRKSVIIFGVSVAHALAIRDVLKGITGQEVEVVHGEMNKSDRERAIGNFKSGRVKYLVNVNVLTTGFDAPNIDCVAIMRATQSPGLLAQIVGRGLRTSPGKQNCIASGSLVLTDQGEVPIEDVTEDMLLWDGVEFVSHGGTINKGIQEVISYEGLTCTPDHKLWTEHGWKEARECMEMSYGVSIGGDGGVPILESSGNFRGGIQERKEGIHLPEHNMQVVPGDGPEVTVEPKEEDGWLSVVREKEEQKQAVSGCTEVAHDEMHISKGSLHEPKKQVMGQVRREGDSVQLQGAVGDGEVHHGEYGNRKRAGDRQDRQRRSLRTREPSTSNTKGKHKQPRGVKGKEVKEVWDILNVGPRNRFTCEGLIVSNCLVLDFGSNFERHGPIDSPDFGKVKEKSGIEQAPAGRARCMVCQNELTPGKRECANCGFANPNDTGPSHDAQAAYGAHVLSESSTRRVASVDYTFNPGRNGKHDTFRVTYNCVGMIGDDSGDLAGRDNQVREWLCFDHDEGSWPQRQAVKWWRARSNAPVPSSVMEAVDLARRGAIANCTGITTEKKGKYDTIVSHVLSDKPASWKGETMLEGAELFSDDFNWDDIDKLPF